MTSMVKGLLRRAAVADLRLLQRIAGHRHPVADAVLPHLSNAANHSKLWLGVGAAMAVTGGRSGRRAAARGVMAILGASALSNAVLKPLLPRPRPPGWVQPLFLFVRRPTSSSFPSGHSASAVAFATATALEAPRFAPPVSALAAGVAYSRMSNGVHFPSDVVVGSAVGAGVALATTWAWPLMDDAPATGRRVQNRRIIEPSALGDGLIVVVNSLAGAGAHDDVIESIRSGLPNAEIVEVDVPTELVPAFERAADAGLALGVVGGDGTVNTAARSAMAHHTPLVVFPGGTLNHFAGDLGIENAEDTIDALRDGHVVAIDVARFGDEIFLDAAAFGDYPDFVMRREEIEDDIGKWPAVVLTVVRSWGQLEPYPVVIDGRQRTVWMIFVGNCAYEPAGFAPATRAQLDDGFLDVRIIDGAGRFSRIRLAIAMATGTLTRSSVYSRELVSEITIRSEDPEPSLAADGEVFDVEPEVSITKDRAALLVFAPHR